MPPSVAPRAGHTTSWQVVTLPPERRHHTRKAKAAEWMDRVSGTNGHNGGADYTALLSRDRDSRKGVVQVTGRDIEEAAYLLNFADGRWLFDGSSAKSAARLADVAVAQQGLGGNMQTVLDVMANYGGELAIREVADKAGLSEAMAQRYLTRHLEAGALVGSRRGVYAILQASVESVGIVGMDVASDNPTDPTRVNE